MRRRLATTTLVALSLVAAACGGDAEAESSTSSTEPADSSTTSQAAASSSTAEATTTTSTTSPTSTSSSSTSTSSTTLAPSTSTTATTAPAALAPPGTVIITAEDGVYLATTAGGTKLIDYSTPPAFPSDRIDFAMSDTRGGVILHPDRSPFFYKGSDAIVYWVPKGGGAAQQMLVPASDQGLQLEDAVVQGDGVGVYYTRLEGTTPDDVSQTLRRFDLDSKTVQEIAEVAGWESGTWNFSVGGDLIVHEWSGEAFTGFFFRDLTGANLNPAWDPTVGGVFDCYPTCHVAVATNPSGTQVAWAQRQGGTFWVTIVDAADGSLEANFSLPDGVYEIHSMDFGSDYLVVNRQEEGSEWYIRPLLVELAGAGLTVDEIPLNGLARLTDVVPELDGVVSFP